MFKKLVTSGVVGTALLIASYGAAFADTVEVVDNGVFSKNTVVVSEANVTVVDQNNSVFVVNKVNSSANSGGNVAFGNTGGDVGIMAGEAKSDTSVVNALNLNYAETETCGCPDDSDTLTIKKNGFGSYNKIYSKSFNLNMTKQSNWASVGNFVSSKVNSGGNKAMFNTGGTVGVGSGPATSNVKVKTFANVNVSF